MKIDVKSGINDKNYQANIDVLVRGDVSAPSFFTCITHPNSLIDFVHLNEPLDRLNRSI
ncbi:MAG: hypothetical protein CSYNP_03528 [Syntrophus sp. SKADARSKE-3]|nr:hypothetical protein [Syntrophus sp. SKADARSKE-3]